MLAAAAAGAAAYAGARKIHQRNQDGHTVGSRYLPANAVEQSKDTEPGSKAPIIHANPWSRNSHGIPTALGSLADLVFGTGSPGGNGIDDYGQYDRSAEARRWRPGHFSGDRVQSEFDRYQSAINRFERVGSPVPEWYINRRDELARQGGAGPGEDYNSETFNEGLTQHLRGLERRRTGAGPRPATWQAENATIRAENAQHNDQRFFDEQVDPQMQTAQNVASGLASTPTFGAQRIADMRSQLGAGIKSSEENRLHMIGSIFGASGGIGSGSPAATALAEHAAQEADTQLATSLNQMGIDTDQMNRENASSASQLLSQLSIARQQARQAATAGDRSRLYQISDNLASTLEAIRASKELRDQQNKTADQAQSAQNKANYIKLGTTAVGSLFGPIGTALGAAAGGAIANKAASGGGGGGSFGSSDYQTPDRGAQFDYDQIYGNPQSAYSA